MKKKGQAAMEFLMTYGWAILAAIIVIGILAFYFRPTGGGAATSRLNEPLYLVASNIVGGAAAADQVNLEVRNDAADTINITGATACLNSGCTIKCVSTTSKVVAVGDTSDAYALADCSVGGPLSVNTDYQGTLTVDYTIGASTVAQRSSGIIAGTAR